jgi:multimeric flavodoxin WrbA
MTKIRILGISATPVVGGNCDKLLQEALKAAQEVGDVDTQFINLSDKKITTCQVCQYCVENKTNCKIKDYMYTMYEEIDQSDGIIVGVPVYVLNISVPFANMMSRFRYFTFFSNMMRNKVVGALSLSWWGVGNDHVIDSVMRWATANNMIPIGGSGATTSAVVKGERADYLEHGVYDDTRGVLMARNIGVRVAEVSRMVKYATTAGETLPRALRRSAWGTKTLFDK